MSEERAQNVSSRCWMGQHGERCIVAYDECACECHDDVHPLPPLDEDGNVDEPTQRHSEEP